MLRIRFFTESYIPFKEFLASLSSFKNSTAFPSREFIASFTYPTKSWAVSQIGEKETDRLEVMLRIFLYASVFLNFSTIGDAISKSFSTRAIFYDIFFKELLY